MSVNINIFRKGTTSATALIESIKAKIMIDQTRIHDLEARYGAAALDAETGDDTQLKEISNALTTARTQLGEHQAALSEAEKRHQAEIAAKRDAEWLEKEKEFEKTLNAFAAQAERMRQSSSRYVEDYRKFVERGIAVIRANPTGTVPPQGTIFDGHYIHKAVAEELARLQNPTIGEPPSNRAPGSAREGVVYDPSAMKSLIDVVFDSNDIALKAAKKGRPK